MNIEITYNNGDTFTACLTDETYENVMACLLDDLSVSVMHSTAKGEEIAELMTKTGSEFNCFPGATTADCEKAGLWWDGCKKCWLDWLKREVEDDK